MKRFIFNSALCILCLIPGFVFAQDANQTFAFAAQQYKNGDYGAAIAAYQRILFFDNGKNRAASFRHLAECYFNLSQYEAAAKNYGLAYFSEQNDSIRNELILKSSQCYLLLNDFNSALTELFNLPDNQPEYSEQKKNFFLAIAYWGMNDFSLSEQYFLKSIDSIDTKTASEIKQQFEKIKRMRINPKTASILSIIFPGAGQLYAGDYKNAVNSLIINAALLALYVHVIYAYSFLDAFLAVFPWFQRYYTGGVKKAGIIAENKIKEKRANIYQNILNTVEESKK